MSLNGGDVLSTILSVPVSDLPSLMKTPDGYKCYLNGYDIIYNKPFPLVKEGIMRLGFHVFLVSFDGVNVTYQRLTTDNNPQENIT